MKRRVIKLGGSLLDCEGLVPRLRSWLAAQLPMQSVMIVGGGAMADAIRNAFALHRLDEEHAHWLCIRVLGVTAELVARLLPESLLVRKLEDLDCPHAENRLVLLEVEDFLRNEASVIQRFAAGTSMLPLPHCWDVTSDSIAVRLATILQADELVLLKSNLPTRLGSLQEVADDGYVDRCFPTAAASLPSLRCVNLRAEGFPETAFVASQPGLRTDL